MRLTWDQYFIKLAEATALRSSCLSRNVGAVLVKDNRVLSTGYNGPPSGLEHCSACKRTESGKGLETCPAVHAEQNAIIYALKTFGDITGATLYVNCQPCTTCCKIIITAGIKKVVYSKQYIDNYGLSLLREAGIEIIGGVTNDI